MKFIHITDSHLVNANQKMFNIPIREVHLHIIAEIYKLKDEIEFLLHTGDISNDGSKESYENAKDLFSNFEIPVYWLPGNHDDLNEVNNFCNDKNIKCEKSFISNDITYILLNSVSLAPDGRNRNRGFLSTEQLEFLNEQINKSKLYPVVIALHHPPIKSETWKDERMLENTEEFFSIINQFNNEKLVLYGHQHQAQIKKYGNTTFYSPPAASFQFDRNIIWGFENSHPGFGIISIKNDNTFDITNKYIEFDVTPIYELNYK